MATADVDKSLLQRFYDDVVDWCKEKSWPLRVPVLLFMAYIGARHFLDPAYWSIFGAINLGIHEGGHLLFRSGGEFICVAGGTVLQLAAPCAAMIVFLKQRDYFGIAFCFGWLDTNLMSIGVYMSDAEKMELPLVTVGGGDEVIHDWRYLFTKLGLLSHCTEIGWLTIQLGNLAMAVCLGSWYG